MIAMIMTAIMMMGVVAALTASVMAFIAVVPVTTLVGVTPTG